MLAGCGFTPLYATAETGGGPALQNVHLVELNSSDAARPTLNRAFQRRTALADGAAEYDLSLSVREQAQPLAVQIDDSVTRYNYRLEADYTLTRRADGKQIRGRAQSVASFNVVSSQYSTLYAEEAAREKAARVLAEEIERDILTKFAIEAQNESASAAASLP